MTLWQSRFSLLGCALTVPGWGEAGGRGGGGVGDGRLTFALNSEIL